MIVDTWEIQMIFKKDKTPSAKQVDEKHLQELLVSRAAWEKELMTRRIAVRNAEARTAEAAEALECVDKLINKVSDRVAAHRIDEEEERTRQMRARYPRRPLYPDPAETPDTDTTMDTTMVRQAPPKNP